jgi:hydroxymethylglutaryl-CoA reductase
MMTKIDYEFKEFRKLNREKKLELIAQTQKNPDEFKKRMKGYRYSDDSLQEKLEQLSENTLSNYHLPYGVAPNFLVDGKIYHIPMVTEEKGVLEAAAKAADFWYKHGGFQTEDIATAKRGYIHLLWHGDGDTLESRFNQFVNELETKNFEISQELYDYDAKISETWLSDMTQEMDHYYMFGFAIETGNEMGATFINSFLEKTAGEFKKYTEQHEPGKLEILMAVLSNYNPGSFVKMKLECPVDVLGELNATLEGSQFAEKFQKAVQVGKYSVSRAVTNNKGIMNGVDALLTATGNDIRSIEAGSHAYSINKGKPESLTNCQVSNGTFTFRITIPLAVGIENELTRLHPLASQSFEILGQPSVKELMKITAAVGLASNFSAITSLITANL